MLEHMSESLAMILNVSTFLALSLGLIIGIFFGALPGLTTTMALAIFVPITFFIKPLLAIPFLLGLYKGGIYGGSIPAILVSTPGTAAAAATVLDGYPLAQQGKAGKALKVALFASIIGETVGNLVLLFVVGLLAGVALLFGPPEYFAILLFSFTIIAALSDKSVLKGFFAAAAGIFLSTIGLDPIMGTQRLSFGVSALDGGLSFVPVLIGLFALSEIMLQAEKKHQTSKVIDVNMKGEGNKLSWQEFKPTLPAIGIGSLVGMWIGLLPGLGQPISCFLSYGLAKKRSKHPELYGKGSIEGVAAAEAGNNSVNGTAMVPMLALGIPGDTSTAILLGAFIAQGLSPGPLLFQTQGPMVYAILLIMLLGNLFFLGIAYYLIPVFSKIASISKSILFPAITAIAVVGAFAVNNSIFDVFVMVVFGIIGYLMKKANIPATPLVIGLLLGGLTETAFSQSLLMSRGNPMIFFTRPIPLVFNIITFTFIAKLIYDAVKKKKKGKAASI